MKIAFSCLLLVLSATLAASARQPTDKSRAADENLVGDWKGASICKANRGVCKDEMVVYHIKPAATANTYSIAADKIVNGELEYMGTLLCTSAKASATLHCTYRDPDHWDFTLAGGQMRGTLVVPDGTIYRVIEVKKVKKDWRTE